ncbi:MAG TPA: class I SAM-dependent methyltransferase [Euzebya sp.]|nr:class I SAM-dependent methyltransferase [Euzebya sp.]
MHAGHQQTAAFVPGMGKTWLLPFYDTLTRIMGVTGLHRRLVGQAAPQSGDRVLEIGCGTGNLTVLVARLHPDTEVVGLDPDEAALRRAQRKSSRRGLVTTWDRGFAQDLPYPDGSFDLVLSSLMLHHLDDEQQQQALREVRRVLVPGGTLHLMDFGGAEVEADGLLARVTHRHPRLEGNFGDGILSRLAEAGLVEPTEVSHVVRRVMGRIAFYRAAAPIAG